MKKPKVWKWRALVAATVCVLPAAGLVQGCGGGDDGNNLFNAISAFAGVYNGALTQTGGAAAGTIALTVNNNGGVTCSVNSTTLRVIFTGTGTVHDNGQFTATASSGQSRINISGTISGSQANGTFNTTSGQTGSFTASKATTNATATPVPGATATPRPTATTSPGNTAQFAGTFLTSYNGLGAEDGTMRINSTTNGTVTATVSSPTNGNLTGSGTLTPTGPNSANVTITNGATSVVRQTIPFRFVGTFTRTTGGTIVVAGTVTVGTVQAPTTGGTAPTTSPLLGRSFTVNLAGTTGQVVIRIASSLLTNPNVTVSGTVNGVPINGTGTIAPASATSANFAIAGRAPDGSLVSFSGTAAIAGTTLNANGTVLRAGTPIGTFSGSATAG